MTNKLINTAVGTIIAGTAFSTTSVYGKDTSHPNILMLIVDDWGAYDLSLTGSKLYETKNIDLLAQESAVFTQGYAAYPRSVPSRYSLITGRHCARSQTGAKTDDRKVNADSYCMAIPFKQAGYQTFIIGKWHVSDGDTMPEDKGFDINIGAGKVGSTNSHFAPFNKRISSNPDKQIHGMDDALPGEYLTDYMSRKTVEYLKKASTSDKPFLAVCSFYAVHTPIEAKEEMTERYRSKIKRLELGLDPMKEEEAGVAKTQQDNPKYAAMIESVDESVGKMLQVLKETEEYDNTIIVLVSDHGGLSNCGQKHKRELATSNLPLKAGKGHLYEGGIRIPYMIRLPKQKRRLNIETPVVNYDLLPTLADLCNVPVSPNAEIDGISLKPLLMNTNEHIHERDLFWHKTSQRPSSTGDYVATAIRSGRYKLIDFYMQNRIELYDIQKDPGETCNLVSQKPALTKELMLKIKEWRKQTGVTMANPERMNHGNNKSKNNKKNR